MRAAPVLLFARSEMRRRLIGLSVLMILVALSGVFVLTAATGARRVATAWSRFGEATRAPDLVATPPIDQLAAVADKLRSQRGVAGVTAVVWMPIRPKELRDPAQGGFAAALPGFGTDVYRALVLDGRLPDQSRAEEFTINPVLSKLTGLRVGDHTTLVSEVPGVEIEGTVVGIAKGPLDTGANGGGPGMTYTLAFAEKFFQPLREYAGDAFQPALIARLDGNADREALVAQLRDALPGATVAEGDVFGTEAGTALKVEERAYWILAAVAGVAAVVALGQILTRTLRQSSDDIESLAAFGCSVPERVVMLVAAPAAAVVAGVVLAFAAAFPASSLVPTGLASRIDPQPGIWVDMRFTLAVTALLAVGLVIPLALAARRLTGSRTESHDPPSISRLTAASRTAASLLGLRAAVGGPDATTRRSARGTTAIVMIALASVVAVPVWTASLDHLRHTPRAHGWAFDTALESVGPPLEEHAAADSMALAIDAAGVASAIEQVDIATVSVGAGVGESSEVELMILQSRRGSLHPTLRAGRAPAAANEIAVPSQILERMDAKIGDELAIETATGSHRLTIVGEAIYPALHNASWGGAASVTAAAIEPLGLQVTASMLFVDLAPGRSVDDLHVIVGPDVQLRQATPPPVVDNLLEAVPILHVLAVFVALLGAATLAHALVTSTYRHRRDHATARAMGLTSRQLRSSYGWHSEAIALMGVVGALPMGFAIGTIGWRLSVSNLGVLDPARVPPLTTVAIAGSTLIFAMLGAFAIAINARRAPLAVSLRTE